MGKCPYCSKEVNIGDFYGVCQEKTSRGERYFKVDKPTQALQRAIRGPAEVGKLWFCPHCDTLLGIT